jgi:hypothetical protein
MDLAFVTGEQKADWFIRSDGGSIYPRHELIDEYRRFSEGKSLRLMSLYELLEEMKVADNVVQDVKYAEVQANTAVLLQRAAAGTELSATSAELGSRALAFVTDRTYSFWGPAKRIDQEGTQVRGAWSVTNVSDQNYVILDARFASHRASYVNIAVEDPMAGMYSPHYPIRAKHRVHLVANFFFFPAICRDGEILTDDVIFTDNYGEEHVVKAVQFRQMGTQ